MTRSTQACFLAADRQCTELPLLRLPRSASLGSANHRIARNDYGTMGCVSSKPPVKPAAQVQDTQSNWRVDFSRASDPCAATLKMQISEDDTREAPSTGCVPTPCSTPPQSPRRRSVQLVGAGDTDADPIGASPLRIADRIADSDSGGGRTCVVTVEVAPPGVCVRIGS